MSARRPRRPPRSARVAGHCGVLAGVLSLAACGGGGDAGTSPPVTSAPASPTTAQRIAAATTTAQANALCVAVQPFYWEVGDRSARLAAGSVNAAGSSTVYTSTTSMSIASASKWLYGAYVVQKRAGALTAADIKFLNFQSGYSNFSQCLPTQTVDDCVAYQNNGVHSNATDGKFSYGGGHMEKHASLEGLGAMGDVALSTELRSQIGTDVNLVYSQPQPAGGLVTTADDYALFLRKVLAGSLAMNAALGTHPVCTNPSTCATAVNTPVSSNESWHYAIGHWVEDDPVAGDGAFSSPGAFGFYPWIDASKSWYGVLARREGAGEGLDSAYCGRLIRKAWVTAVAQ